jgi:hypothetical protein
MGGGLNFIDFFYVVLPFGNHRDNAHRREARKFVRILSDEQRADLKRIAFDKAHRGYKTLPCTKSGDDLTPQTGGQVTTPRSSRNRVRLACTAPVRVRRNEV